MSYDVIGDIHGQAAKLESLLRKLGYQLNAGVWSHPGRKATIGEITLQDLSTVQTQIRHLISSCCLESSTADKQPFKAA